MVESSPRGAKPTLSYGEKVIKQRKRALSRNLNFRLGFSQQKRYHAFQPTLHKLKDAKALNSATWTQLDRSLLRKNISTKKRKKFQFFQ